MLTLTVLGSGGNSPIPTPTCGCRVCERARREGIPHARHGNSLYVEELAALVDAPEFVYENLEREGIDDLEYLFLTHWHPDHSAGLRVVQSRSMERMFSEPDHGLVETARGHRPTLVTTRRVYERTCEVYAGVRHFVEDVGFADTHFLDEAPLTADGVRIEAVPYSLSGTGDMDATAFVLEDGETTLLLATDDARYLEESALPTTSTSRSSSADTSGRPPTGPPSSPTPTRRSSTRSSPTPRCWRGSTGSIPTGRC
jgi:phosphoribosyl 1,2-cyclic phosphate phosphodiesterase